MSTNSIAVRLSALFTLVAMAIFLLSGWAVYCRVTNSLDLLPQAELDARYSVLESLLTRDGSPERWSKIVAKLTLLEEEDRRLHFWVVSANPAFEYGAADEQIRQFVHTAGGKRDLVLPGHDYPLRVLDIALPALGQRPPLHFLAAIETDTFSGTRNTLFISLVSFAVLGVLLACALGYWVARVGLRPLVSLSREVQKLAPPRLSGRLQLSPLPPELDQFVSAFNSSLERVDQAYGRLEAFNADVAHELRSPLTNLIGQTQVALTRGRSAEHYLDVLQSNLEELERLRSIVNDMLFLASADQGSKATQLTASSLAEEVATTVEYLDFILEDARISVRVTGDARVHIERAHLRRALINLLNNAVQHTAAGQRIDVHIQAHDAWVDIEVSNPGPRIAEEHLPMLFERFYRVDASRSNSGGNHGLGLAIVKAIALMHGGSVFVRSQGGANTFGISLPA